MSARSARSLVLVALGALAGAASARAALTTVSVTELAIGTIVDVTGDSLSTAPKAALVNVATSKKYPVKVLKSPKATDTAFSFQPTKGALGDFKLVVTPKGSKTSFEFPGFTFPKPEIRSVTPATATPNSVVEISGRWLGTAKGKVLVNGKPASGVVWNGASGKIQFRAPKKTGLLDLQVVTPVGAGDVRTGALAVNAGVTGKTRMRFTIGGREVVVTDESQIQASLSHPRTGIAEVGFYAIQPPQNANEGRTVVSLSGRVPDGTLLPYTVPNTADEDKMNTYVSYDRAGVSDGNPNTIDDLDFYSAYQGITVEITGIDYQTNRISGRAFGTLQKADYLTGTLGATAEFTCEFNVLLDQRL